MLRSRWLRWTTLAIVFKLAVLISPLSGQDATPSAHPATRSARPALAHTLEFQGFQRRYLLYRPSELSKTSPVPLVVMLHGRFDTDHYAETAYHWNETAAANGFVVVYPEGVHRMWNAGRCCGWAKQHDVDDVGYLTALIMKLTKEENIDTRRIYLAGMSMGALMAYRMACESSLNFAAIGSVSGDVAIECPSPHPASVIEIHGGRDHLLPIDGKRSPQSAKYIPPVNETLSHWRVVDRCDDAHTTATGQVTEVLTRCDAGRAIELIVIADAGHQWPEAKPHMRSKVLHIDQPSKHLDATTQLWEFFAAHPMHEQPGS